MLSTPLESLLSPARRTKRTALRPCLSSASFTELHTISSLSILPPYTTIPYKINTNIVSLTTIDSINTNHASHDFPAPTFALSHRILAYASPPPRADSHVGAVSQPRTRLHSPSAPSEYLMLLLAKSGLRRMLVRLDMKVYLTSMLNGVASGYRISRRSLLCCSSFENLRWI
ncbi:hypothetical protein P692DRAFT_20216536 [Suillus brevipes Sb2]|nr:hypothetical protein P692DRAFT_20216536 [Suillus brevipes Sb2]